jgi:hypothetical protein
MYLLNWSSNAITFCIKIIYVKTSNIVLDLVTKITVHIYIEFTSRIPANITISISIWIL